MAHAVELLAEQIEGETKKSWRDDSFTAQALLHGVIHLLGHFAPHKKGTPVPRAIKDAAAKMPPAFAERFSSPEGFAGVMAYRLVAEIRGAASPAPTTIWNMPIFFSAKPEILGLIGRDLGLTKQGKEAPK